MRLNLFHIPPSLWGYPVFGFGWLLGIWGVVSLVVLIRQGQKQGTQAVLGSLPSMAITGAILVWVLPRLIDPVEGFPVRGYGVMLVLAIVAAVGLAVARARRAGLDPEIIYSLAFCLVVSGVAGARLFYVVQNWREFARPTWFESLKAVLSFNEGGLVVYGSLLAGGAGLFYFLRKHRLPGLALADLVVPSVILGMAIGRIGCFLTGCCFGATCDLPWAVTFPWGSPPHMDQIVRGEANVEGIRWGLNPTGEVVAEAVAADSPAARAGLHSGDRVTAIGFADPSEAETKASVQWHRLRGLSSLAEYLEHLELQEQVRVRTEEHGELAWQPSGAHPRSLPVHPVQLYSFFDALLLCGFLLAFSPFRRHDGELLALLLIFHSFSRFLLEMLRNDELPVWGTPFHISQNISIISFAVGLALWSYLRTQPPGVASFAKVRAARGLT